MKVTISVLGAFQAYQLANQIEKLGVLRRLYTSNAKVTVKVPHSKVWNFWPIMGAHYAASRVVGLDLSLRASQVFDVVVARMLHIGDIAQDDVFHGWASFCAQSFAVANRRGYKTIVDRACPHIRFQQELLREEADRQGLGFPEDGFAVADRMLEEYELAHFIVVPSRYSYDSFIAHGVDPRKLRIVPLGVEQTEFQRRRRNHAEKVRVLFVGGNPLRKGLRDLLEAWHRLRLPGAELLIRGTVPPELRGLATHSTIRIVPKLSKTELWELYRSAVFFCLPSVDDGFGMAVLEAMAYGLPVIITENVGAKDLVRRGVDGFVVPVGDVSALMEKLEFLYLHGEVRESMGQAAFERAGEFPWSKYAESMTAVYREVLTSTVR